MIEPDPRRSRGAIGVSTGGVAGSVSSLLHVIGLAIGVFVSTNVDDVVVLLAFFADPRFRGVDVVAGQYLGLSLLLLISVMAALASMALSPAVVGLLGLLPVLIGLAKLVTLFRGAEEGTAAPRRVGPGNVLAVAGVTLANGGDNVGVYTPVLASRSPAEMAVIGVVFTVMTALWLTLARALVTHPRLGAPLRRYGRRVVPFVLIGLGMLVVVEAGSLRLLWR